MAKELRCPDITYWAEGQSQCDLNRKACIRESGGECHVYQEFLEETQAAETEAREADEAEARAKFEADEGARATDEIA
jgi:hypothetical protein